MKIDTKKYSLSDLNYIPFETKKDKIIIGSTNNKDMRHFIGWEKRMNGKYKKTAHYTIGLDGSIYQHIDPKFYTNYFKYYDLNSKSIIILLENEGFLLKNTESNKYITWLGDIYEDDNVFEKKWRRFNYWVPYTKKQFNATVSLTSKLCEEFSINKEVISHNTKLNELGDFTGVLYKSNLEKFYTDLNPSWDFEIFKEKVESNEK